MEINDKLQKELKKKKKELESELQSAEEVYMRKETIKKKLTDLKKDAENQDKEYQDELRKLRYLIEQDKKIGIIEEEKKGKILANHYYSDYLRWLKQG